MSSVKTLQCKICFFGFLVFFNLTPNLINVNKLREIHLVFSEGNPS